MKMHRRKVLAAVLAINILRKRIERRKKKRLWRRNWIAAHDKQGAYRNLLRQLDRRSCQNYLRMSPEQFYEILQRVGPIIERQDTNFRSCIYKPGRKTDVDDHVCLSTGFYYNNFAD